MRGIVDDIVPDTSHLKDEVIDLMPIDEVEAVFMQTMVDITIIEHEMDMLAPDLTVTVAKVG